MSRRNKIIIVVAAVLVALLIIFGLVWWLGGRGPVTPATNQAGEPERLPVTSVNKPPSLVKAPDVEASLKAVASTFTERFGSYSNQGSFGNLEDLRGLLTVKMRGTIDSLIAEQRAKIVDSSTYYGITTQALVVTITSFDESLGRAAVTVNTQRSESKGSTVNPRIFYQKIDLKLAKVSDSWKIDEAVWQ